MQEMNKMQGTVRRHLVFFVCVCVYMKQPLIKWRFAADRNEVRGGVTTWRNRPFGGTEEIYKPLCCDKAGSAADGEISVQLKQ